MSSEEEEGSGTSGEAADRPRLHLTEFEEGIEKCIENLGGRVKHCGRSAIRHLRGAWSLHGIDDEMCGFRAITAEEEAASALILSLKQKQYPGATRLNFRDHVQKVAVTPFLLAVQNIIALSKVNGKLHLSPDGERPRIDVSIDVKSLGLNFGELKFAQPDEPLNFLIQSHRADGSQEVLDFEEQLRNVAQADSVEKIAAFIQREANLRNELLYASDTGVPHAAVPEGFLQERRRRVFLLLILTIAVQQTPRHQLFAVQCLRAFLRVVRRIEAPEFDFGAAATVKDGLTIVIDRRDGVEPKTWLRWRYRCEFRHQYPTGLAPAHSDTARDSGSSVVVDRG